ncbi:MAG TPA: DNA primase [Chitinophagaceae bacterium]|nr:DNA primase [Chitinophagaceae bacterium]
MISKSTIQKVNDAADLLDVVGAFIKLKKRGANYLGNCPFHNEKTPSFTVSPTKGIYKCFGCGKAGNVITFIQEHEKLTYPEAIIWLAKRYHIEVEETEISKEAKENQLIEESLRIINTFATQYFNDLLLHHPEGETIGLSYFQERGFRKDTIEKFQLGYCLEDRDHLSKEAIEKGYSKELLVKAGLVYDRYEKLQSIYAGRVVFPIHNQSGKVIGFGARILKTNEKAPKYINTPENEIYHKSKTLYGIYFAKNSISSLNECYLVEGYTDVISLHQTGIENVVASSGTSLTEDQLKLIKRYTKNLTILYDGDAAGIKAALRGLDMAIEQGLNVTVVLLPNNHDPDSYVREVGIEKFNEYVKQNKKDIILFKLEASLKEANDDSVKKSELINDIAETLSKINKVEEFTKQQDYVRRCSQLLQIDEAGLIALVNKKIREKVSKQDQVDKRELETLEQQANPDLDHLQPVINELLKKDYLQERGLVRILIENGDKPYDEKMSIADYIRLKVGDADFENQSWLSIYNAYYAHLDATLQFPDTHFFTYHDDEKIRTFTIEALYFPYELSAGWEEKHHILTPTKEMTYINDVNDTVTFFLLRKIRNMHKELFDELRTLNDSNPDEVMVLQLSIIELKKTEANLLEPMKSVMTK